MSFDHDSICYFSHCPMPLYIVVEPFQIVNPKVKDSYINLEFQNLTKKFKVTFSSPNRVGHVLTTSSRNLRSLPRIVHVRRRKTPRNAASAGKARIEPLPETKPTRRILRVGPSGHGGLNSSYMRFPISGYACGKKNAFPQKPYGVGRQFAGRFHPEGFPTPSPSPEPISR